MKKTFLHFLLIFLLFGLSNNSEASVITKSHIKCLQQNSYKSYIFYNGNWHTGEIRMRQTENGHILSSYSFDDIYLMGNQTLSGYFYPDQQLIKLNPNSDLAKNNNFTHYVEIQGLRAYIIAN